MKTLIVLLCLCAAGLRTNAQDAELEMLREGLTRAEKAKNKDSIATACCLLSEYYAYRSTDSARHYAEQSLAAMDTEHSPLYATVLTHLADAYFSEGKLEQAYRLFIQACNAAERQRDTAIWASAYISLGVVCRQQDKPDSTLLCYNTALRLLEGREDYAEQAQVLGSLAIFYANRKRLDEALVYGKRAVEAAAKSKDLDMIMYANYACGSIYFLQKRHDEGIGMIRAVTDEGIRQEKPNYAMKAYTMILEMFKSTGERDSLDYYTKKAEALLPRLPENSLEVLGFREEQYLIYMNQGRYRESLKIQQQLLEHSGNGLHIPVDKLYLMMARNYDKLQEPANAARYYEEAYRLCDSLYSERVNTELSDLTVKYDTKEKELEILRLTQVQLEQETQLLYWIIATVAITFLLLILALLYFTRRKQLRKEQELKLARRYIDGLERERTRLAKELHDGICNDLLGIGMQVECMSPDDNARQTLLQLLEQVRNDVRCISHELMPPKFQDVTLPEAAEAYIGQLATRASVRLSFSETDRERAWDTVPEQVAYEAYRILQELLANILKHAGATEVQVLLALEKKQLKLQITADGLPAMELNQPAAEPHRTVTGNGIGLTTICERIKSIGGFLTTDIRSERQLFLLDIPLTSASMQEAKR